MEDQRLITVIELLPAEAGNHYCYYVCHQAQKRGWQVCPSPSIPAGEIERFVINEIKCVGRDPRLIEETLVRARREVEEQMEQLTAERKNLQNQLRATHAKLIQLATASHPGDPHLAEAHDHIRDAERRVTEIDDQLITLDGDLIDEVEVATALADFDAMWDCLTPREQARVIELLIERVAYDGHNGKISITFRPAGIKLLVRELANKEEQIT